MLLMLLIATHLQCYPRPLQDKQLLLRISTSPLQQQRQQQWPLS
jgi:hypothetical protein